MSYRIAEKSKKVLYIDVSEVPAEHLDWFMKGAQAAVKAVESAETEEATKSYTTASNKIQSDD